MAAIKSGGGYRVLEERYRRWTLGSVEKIAKEMVSEQSSEIDIRILGWTVSYTIHSLGYSGTSVLCGMNWPKKQGTIRGFQDFTSDFSVIFAMFTSPCIKAPLRAHGSRWDPPAAR
jgi:hypothetical protein